MSLQGESADVKVDRDNDRPPAYSPPDFMTQTETETVITRTTTITTFFLPKRKRSRSKSINSSRPSSSRGEVTREPSPRRASAQNTLLINKTLPPPPSDQLGQEHRLFPSTVRDASSIDLPSRPAIKRSASYAALSLSLGVGVTPLLPNELRRIPATTLPDLTSASGLSQNTSQRRVTVATAPLEERSKSIERPKSANPEIRRRRGFSLGPLDFLSSSKSHTDEATLTSTIKEVDASIEETPRTPTTAQPSINPAPPGRRPSFWRLRVSSFGSSSPASNASSSSPPPLPLRSPLRPTPAPLKIPPLEPSSPLFSESPLLPVSPSSSLASSNPFNLRKHLVQRRHSTKESTPPKSHLYASANLATSTPSIRASQPNPLGEDSSHAREGYSVPPPPGLPPMTSASDLAQIHTPWFLQAMHSSQTTQSQGPSSPASFLDFSNRNSEELDQSPNTSQSALQDANYESYDKMRLSQEARKLPSPELYVQRLQASVSKTEMAGVLASSGDQLHTNALKHYMSRFQFTGDAIDIALRKMLMELGLPKETQQIDRVMEAFAHRYSACNPNLFIANDQPYILAFSMIMLHTDAFNKHNKHKMTKTDYIKNTRLPGVSSEILEYLFDNIVFAPFIFIEDPVDVDGQPGFLPNPTSARVKSNRVDPYYLITNNLLSSLRVEVDEYIPPFDPYLYEGTLGPWDEQELRSAFSKAPFIEVGEKRPKPETPISFNGLTIGGAGGPMINAPIGSVDSSSLEAAASLDNIWTLRVTKVGLLSRKEDISEGGKRSTNRKWKEWSVILTGSQLLFFRDPSWALGLMAQASSLEQQPIFPHTAFLRPDELISVKDTVVVYDKTFIKHSNTMRLVLPNGRHLLLRAQHEQEMNEWISLFNYSSAFKSAGIRMRTSPLLPPLTTDRRTSLNHPSTSPSYDQKSICVSGEDEQDSVDPCSSPTMEALNIPFPPSRLVIGSPPSSPTSTPLSPAFTWRDDMSTSFNPSRSFVIRNKLQELEAKVLSLETQLEVDLRVSRNLALLTAFQKSTREKIQLCVMPLAKRVQSLRLELTKLQCHRYVLTCDLKSAEEERKLNRRSYTIPGDLRSLASSRRRSLYSSNGGMGIPPHDLTLAGPQLQRSKSSMTTASLRSPRDDLEGARSRLRSAPDCSPNSARLAALEQNLPEYGGVSSSGRILVTELPSTDPDYPRQTESEREEAEEWNQTRAAKRVSLVRFPSNIALPPLSRTVYGTPMLDSSILDF